MRNVFGTHVYIAEGMHGQFSIHNRVYETYGRDSWARLTGLRKTGTGIARGAWSPDSTRLYTELNPPV